MTTPNNNPYAFPSPEDDRAADGYGMTLHDHLVGQSLAGLCSNPSFVDGGDLKAMKAQAEYVALMARMIADASLGYRESAQ